MKLIIGLGNPGSTYKQTRHNVGFMLLDELAEKWGAGFQEKPRFRALVAETELEGEKILLIKPVTFYNLVGESARAIRDFYKCDNADVVAVHDDMALPFGVIRTRLNGSDGGNNGIKSLNQQLGHDYARIRVGIWNEDREHIDATDFVLGKLTKTQHVLLTDAGSTALALLVAQFAETGTLQPHTVRLESS